MNNIINPKNPYVTKETMNPRNIYRGKHNFTQLAIDYPEFRKIAKQDIKGFMSIDFKNEESLRILNKTLLKKDFNLDVKIPPGFLVPTVSLRLNYILWIEDILNIISQDDTINGIDIGTGATCVYMLLGAQKNNWHMIGTEIDPESIKYAQENINNNNLGHLLKVILTKNDEPLFKFLSNDTIQYHFCMCNPPFYSSTDELSSKGRKSNRPRPKNVQTGKTAELTTEGGEIEFIMRIIHESKDLQTRIKVYTTMVGHKKNIPALIDLLKEVQVKNFIQTEFYQGHTSRWGLAWTFCEDINLNKIREDVVTYDKSKKKSRSEKNAQKPLIYQFTNPNKYPSLEILLIHLKKLFDELQLKYIQSTESDHVTFDITAYVNTWTHQRQKRRQENRQQSIQEISSNSSDNQTEIVQITESTSNTLKRPAEISFVPEMSDAKKAKIEEPLVKFKMAVEVINLNQFQLTLLFMEGTLKKDAMNQILTYLKNKIQE